MNVPASTPPAERSGSPGGIRFCTVIARNFLPYARVLAASLSEHHPEHRLTVFVLDDLQRELDAADEPFDVLHPDDIDFGPGEFARMATLYDVTELATAVKPWLLRHLLAANRVAVYLDPDIRIHSPLEGLEPRVLQHGIVLTPHTTVPVPRDHLQADEQHILTSGLYNLGFLAVDSSAHPFLDWWSGHLARHCIIDHARGLFVDQRWVDLAPLYFDAYIERDTSWNVAYWNLHARDLRWTRDGYRVDGRPLTFFHFSGYRPAQPHLLSSHQGDRPRLLLSERPDIRRICNEYASDLHAAGYEEAIDLPYGYGTLADGTRMDRMMRRLYRDALLAHEIDGDPEPPNPFEAGTEAFLDWLAAPPAHGPSPRIGRYLAAIYAARPDLQTIFRDLSGSDADGLLDWATRHGVEEYGIPPRLVTEGVTETFPPGNEESPRGLNVVGYFRAELGIGEAGRQMLSALDAGGIRYRTISHDDTRNRQEHPFEDRHAESLFDTNLICVNSDRVPWLARDIGRSFFQGRYNIGLWFWEASEFPPSVRGGLALVDEIWVASEYTRASIAAATDKPVVKIPLPVAPPKPAMEIGRTDLRLPESFLFLFVFDYFSILERKNPLGLIEAFKRAFAPDEGPVLVLKTINGDYARVKRERLHLAIADRPDIIVIDHYLSVAEKDGLMGLADCYVSLHRAEGFGLTMAESMAMGKPVIATGYSGNLEFMTAENSYLVEHRLRRIGKGADPYPENALWAEPDLDHAASLMRRVVDRPEEAKAKAIQAQQDIRALRRPELTAEAIKARLAGVHRQVGGHALASASGASQSSTTSPWRRLRRRAP